jgi:hypothetical protein
MQHKAPDKAITRKIAQVFQPVEIAARGAQRRTPLPAGLRIRITYFADSQAQLCGFAGVSWRIRSDGLTGRINNAVGRQRRPTASTYFA